MFFFSLRTRCVYIFILGHPSSPQSLHYNGPNKPSQYNGPNKPSQYIQALQAIGGIIEDYDT